MAGRPLRSFRVVAVASVLTTMLAFASAAPAGAAGAARAWDFDGDGYRDLVVGVPGENELAGGILAVRGASWGLRRASSVRLSQDSPGVPGTAEPHDQFGATFASGDFDRDGYADLAVAAPDEDTSRGEGAGLVAVLYGGPDGLTGEGSHLLRRPERVLGEIDFTDAAFGFRLAAADFDRDGYRDLVAAVSSGRGGVLVYRGGQDGLRGLPAQQIGPDHGIEDLGGAFPEDLDVGDLDGNGAPDLAIGWQEADFARGAAVVIYSTPGVGLDLRGKVSPAPQVWTEDSSGVKGVAKPLDAFGSAIGVGDVTGDGRNDLVVAVLQQPTGIEGVTGALHVLKGSRNGVTARGDQHVKYPSLVDEPLGALGVELEVGDLDANGVDDVAVTHGSSAESWYGAVVVLDGGTADLGGNGAVSFTQATPGIAGRSRSLVDYWGLALRIRDVGRSHVADLVVGDPYEVRQGVMAGMANVLWGSSDGLSGDVSTGLSQETRDVPGVSEEGDRFGGAL